MDSNDLPEVERIFEEAFPANEKIFSIKQLIEKSDEMNISVSSITDEDKLVGLTVIINNDEWNYLMHFAIDSNIRGGGYGSRAMKSIMDYCGDKTLIFVIEAPDEKAENAEQRVRRKNFYLKNHMFESGVNFSAGGVDFEALTSKENIEQSLLEKVFEFFSSFMSSIGIDIVK